MNNVTIVNTVLFINQTFYLIRQINERDSNLTCMWSFAQNEICAFVYASSKFHNHYVFNVIYLLNEDILFFWVSQFFCVGQLKPCNSWIWYKSTPINKVRHQHLVKNSKKCIWSWMGVPQMWERHSIIYLLQFKKGLLIVQIRRDMSALKLIKSDIQKTRNASQTFLSGKINIRFQCWPISYE